MIPPDLCQTFNVYVLSLAQSIQRLWIGWDALSQKEVCVALFSGLAGSFPGVSDSDEDEDEEVEVGERWSRELEDMRGRFSGQVEKIIVGPLPRPRIYNGVDLSILELTTND
ncbi:hypothetical protein FRC08_001310 [Ceratobasidium sp. 394]|nr:hypothetical protein FRC08_001310 [Ceratobasidium sp. 394]